MITLPRISMRQHCTITLLNWTSFGVSIFAETREDLGRLLQKSMTSYALFLLAVYHRER